MEISSRYVHVLGITANPDGPWTVQQIRPPRPDHPPADLSKKRIQRRPLLGGLINEYERVA